VKQGAFQGLQGVWLGVLVWPDFQHRTTMVGHDQWPAR
jgi:hypothetical protein